MIQQNSASRIRLILIVVLVFLPCLGSCSEMFVLENVNFSGLPAIAPELAWPWDICKKDSIIEKEFFIPIEQAYQFLIGFAGKDAVTEDGKIKNDANQAWRSQFGEFDESLSRMNGPLSTWIGEAGSSAVRMITAHREPQVLIPLMMISSPSQIGVVVPMHVQIENIDARGVNKPVFTIDSIETAGRMSGGYLATRAILWAHLKRGKYRVTAKILKNSPPLPEGVHTYLYIRLNPAR
jgi:hypothetical protein